MSAVTNPTSIAAAADFTSAELASQPNGSGTNDGFNSLGTGDFLTLLVQELQNQDPLNPVDNADMVAQIGQIREIGATGQLTESLTNLSNNQELVTASGLIGRTVEGLGDDQSNVDGVVDRISVETNTENDERSVKVHVGGRTISIGNIRNIQPG